MITNPLIWSVFSRLGFSVLAANLVPRVDRLLLSRIFGVALIASGIKPAFF